MENYNFELYSRLKKNFWYITSRQDLLKRILKTYYSNRKNLKILDAGCGTGFNFDALKDFGNVYGVDLNKNALKNCKFDYKKLELKDVNKLNYKNYFDVVVAIELIEHIEDDYVTVKNFNKFLKPGGLLIITIPAFRFLWSNDDELAMHKRRYSKKRLFNIIKKADFEIKHLGYRYFFLFFPAIFVFLLQKFRKKRNSLEYTPSLLNGVLLNLMKLENRLILKRWKFLFGVGLICIAKKRQSI